MRFVKEGYTWFIEALFPPRCLVCREEGKYLCVQHCHFLAAPECKSETRYLDDVFAATDYHHPTTEKTVEFFKFRGFQQVAEIMAAEMARKLPSKFLEDNILVPVPLHWTRKFWRGFNQAEQLCLELQSQIPQMKISKDLKRIRKTHQQSRLKKEERLRNLEDAFVWQGESCPSKVILVDDVMASGATLDFAAKVLKKAGVKEVCAFVFARSGWKKNVSIA